MEKLTKTEEPVMKIIWNLKKVFVKDIIRNLPDPKPPYNTVSSIVRILESKKMVGYESFGRTHRYFPLVSQSVYKSKMIGFLVNDYFGGSTTSLLSYIVAESELNNEETEELKNFIKEKL